MVINNNVYYYTLLIDEYYSTVRKYKIINHFSVKTIGIFTNGIHKSTLIVPMKRTDDLRVR